jgi:hypothetical protein
LAAAAAYAGQGKRLLLQQLQLLRLRLMLLMVRLLLTIKRAASSAWHDGYRRRCF